jgi:hypothetical protein
MSQDVGNLKCLIARVPLYIDLRLFLFTSLVPSAFRSAHLHFTGTIINQPWNESLMQRHGECQIG